MQVVLHVKNGELSGIDDEFPEPEGVSLTQHLDEDVGTSELAMFFLSILAGVPINLVSSWLFEKLKKRGAKTIQINKQKVSATWEDIERALNEETQR